MFYGNNIDNSEYLYEQSIFNEMHISKKDLMNPNILNKVLEKSKKEQWGNTAGILRACYLLGIAADILTGLVTGSILLAFGLFVPFIIGALIFAAVIVSKLPDYEKKNLDKLEAKAKKVKEKAEKMKDSQDKTKIIKACDKVLKAIEDYKQQKITEAERKRYEANKKFVRYIVNTINGENGPDSMIDEIYETYYVADKIDAIKPSELDKIYTNYCSKHLDEGVMSIIVNRDNYEDALKHPSYSEYEIEEIAKKIPGFKDNAPAYNIGSTGDYYLFFNSKDKKYYYLSEDPTDEYSVETSLYKLVCDNKYMPADYSDKDIEMFKQIYQDMTAPKEDNSKEE